MRKLFAVILAGVLTLGAVGLAGHQGSRGDGAACAKGPISQDICDSYDE